MEATKETKCQRLINLDDFMVFGTTTFGGFNDHRSVEIGRAYTSSAPSEEEAIEDQCHLTQKLLMVLNREVAHMLRSGLPL